MKRWSAKCRQAVVLRLLVGESLDALSRETGESASALSRWREEFMEGGLAALKQCSEDPKVAALEKELRRTKRLVGDLARANRPVPPLPRGRKPVLRDEALVEKIREVLSEAEGLGFWGEGYRKVRARFRHRGIPVLKEWVRRLMREHGLQAPHRLGNHRGPYVHDGGNPPPSPPGGGGPALRLAPYKNAGFGSRDPGSRFAPP